MKLRAPPFWNRPKPCAAAWLLAPFSGLVRFLGWKRQKRRAVSLSVPILCCGGVTVGGTGKTPLTLDLVRRLQKRGYTPHIVTRGYGGKKRRGRRVSLTHHTPRDVGDEALLLAAVAPTWAGRDRVRSARLAIAHGADCLVLDDGLQDPSLHKHFSVLTLDGGIGTGNGLLLPAGPLREPLKRVLKRVQTVAIIGEDKRQVRRLFDSDKLPEAHAHFAPLPEQLRALAGRQVVAFAGIGRPEKFFDMLRDSGVSLLRGVSFPDHHVYSKRDLKRLRQLAQAPGVVLATTEKDAVKLPPSFRKHLHVLRAELIWSDPKAPERLLDRFFAATDMKATENDKKISAEPVA